jgi:hypothetical protein
MWLYLPAAALAVAGRWNPWFWLASAGAAALALAVGKGVVQRRIALALVVLGIGAFLATRAPWTPLLGAIILAGALILVLPPPRPTPGGAWGALVGLTVAGAMVLILWRTQSGDAGLPLAVTLVASRLVATAAFEYNAGLATMWSLAATAILVPGWLGVGLVALEAAHVPWLRPLRPADRRAWAYSGAAVALAVLV